VREENVARIGAFAEWLAAGRGEGSRNAAEILSQPAVDWNGWLAAHPEAATLHTLQAMLHAAASDPRTRAIADFVLAHADRVGLPADAEPVRTLLRVHGWRLRGDALRDAGDLRAALGSYEQSIQAFGLPPALPDEMEAVGRDAAVVRQQLQEEERVHTLVERMLEETPAAAWPELAERPELHGTGVLHELSRQFNVRVHRAPTEALVVTRLAVAIAARLAEASRGAAVAWRDHATALRLLARYEESLAAFDRAAAVLPLEREELARAAIGIARGATLQEAGRFEEAMLLLRECQRVFEEYGDSRGRLFCGISEGALLHRTERYREACDLYRSLLPFAEEVAGTDAVASIHNNLGHSAIELGDFALAESHLSEAVRLFAGIASPLQVARAELARGRLMIRRGALEQGIGHLHRVREELLRHNLVEEAGLCGLDVVEAHLTRGAPIEAEVFARQIVREFTAARLNSRAITALRFLSEAIAARKASGTTVRHVQRFIGSLRANPDSAFAAAS